MTPAELSAALRAALTAAVDDGTFALDAADVPRRVHVERPRNREHGDWASNVAMKLAQAAGHRRRASSRTSSPRRSPTSRASPRSRSPAPASSTSRSTPPPPASSRGPIVEAGRRLRPRRRRYAGHDDQPRVRLGQPDRPASTSAACAGPPSATASRACCRPQGAIVTREYYFNDHGAQIDRFARSLLAAHRGEPAPEDGYGGAYIADIAARVVAEPYPPATSTR